METTIDTARLSFPLALGTDPLSLVDLHVYSAATVKPMLDHLSARVRRMLRIGGRPDVAATAAKMAATIALTARPELCDMRDDGGVVVILSSRCAIDDRPETFRGACMWCGRTRQQAEVEVAAAVQR